MKYKTEVYVWSRIGNTPVTQRRGAFCDVLVHTEIEVADPAEARTAVNALLATTPHADKGYFNMPTWPNQNVRSQWL